jgi:hypothetical protein
MEQYLAPLHVSTTAAAPLSAQALNGAWPRDPSVLTGAVVLISWDQVCSPAGCWTVRGEFRPAIKASTDVPYGSAAAVGGKRCLERSWTSVCRAAVSCGLR